MTNLGPLLSQPSSNLKKQDVTPYGRPTIEPHTTKCNQISAQRGGYLQQPGEAEAR